MSVELHRAPIVFPGAAPAIIDGAVAVRAGRVLDVGDHDTLARAHPDAARHEWSGALTPGLVNAHTHLQYTSMAEVGQAEHSGFETWMQAFQDLYERPHDWHDAATAGAALSLRGGTTAVAEIVTDPAAASAVHAAGLHGVVFWEVMGWTDAAWAVDGRSTVLEHLRQIPSPPLVGISPHAVYSLDTGVLRDLAGLAAELGVRQHIHASESAWEDAYVRTGTGDLADTWRTLEGRSEFALLQANGCGRSVIGYLDDLGSLSPATHLAHGIYVDADDRRILRDRGVVVALCPRSNAVIGLDAPPVADYLSEGNAIAVGTDSLSSSPSLSVLEDVAALYRLARAQGYRHADLHRRLFAAATSGGATALGLDDAGALRPGSRADLSVFPITATNPADALAELVEDGPATADATVIAGRIRWQERRH